MRSPGIRCYASSVGAAIGFLAGCNSFAQTQSDAQPPIIAQRIAANTSSYQVLYRFGVHDNPHRDRGGANPGGLLEAAGTFYGTTYGGGHFDEGTAYSFSSAGVKTTLHRFGIGNGGIFPVGPLIEMNGLLYGATTLGGACGSGSVYSMSTTGTVTILHSFCYPEGIQPASGPIDADGTLYGTTEALGGSGSGWGTVYSLTTTGNEKVLHTFTGPPDGAEPVAPLLNVNGTLYGTTVYGGTGCHSGGCGTVFSISTTGKEKVLYSFQGGSDGALPLSGLIDVNGTFYGTTLRGGGNHLGCQPSYAGCGTVFSITTSGSERVVYRFNGTNGTSPNAGLLEMNGSLYGTASSGGSSGWGVVFSLSASGGESVLHNFADGNDGANPTADLIEVNGVLYGTTWQGGSNGCNRLGCGTIFAISPSAKTR